jgi:hypothetical protein
MKKNYFSYILFLGTVILINLAFVFTLLAAPGKDISESDLNCNADFYYESSLSSEQTSFSEFKGVEKSDFNTSFMPSYYTEIETIEQNRKVLVIVYDVLGRESFTKARMDRQLLVRHHDLDDPLMAGLYMIIGVSEQRYFMKRLVVE